MALDGPQAAKPRQFEKWLWNYSEGFASSVGRRFAFVTIACSSVLALFMTIVQLGVDYQAEKKLQGTTLARLELSVLPALAESLWLLDEALIMSQLTGIAQFEGVSRVTITDAEELYEVVNEAAPVGWPTQIPITRRAGGELFSLGTLVVHANTDHITQQLLRRALVLLATNALKTICVVFMILYLFQRFVGQHLSELAMFARTYDPDVSGQRLQLARTGISDNRQSPCEFLQLEKSINRWAEVSEKKIDQLHNANREQADFTYSISHDLKSPSNTMSMLIDELEECGVLGGEGHDVLSDMRATNGRMGQLIEDILSYSRIVGEGLQCEPVNLEELIAHIEQDLAADIKKARAKIQYEDLPVIQANPAQMRILLQNLIANAVKFRSPERSVVVKIEVEPVERGHKITVSDNGIGIPVQYRGEIFGLFKRLHGRSEYDGSGLGLAMCKRVVANHGGSICVASDRDQGTAFEITLNARNS